MTAAALSLNQVATDNMVRIIGMLILLCIAESHSRPITVRHHRARGTGRVQGSAGGFAFPDGTTCVANGMVPRMAQYYG